MKFQSLHHLHIFFYIQQPYSTIFCPLSISLSLPPSLPSLSLPLSITHSAEVGKGWWRRWCCCNSRKHPKGSHWSFPTSWISMCVYKIYVNHVDQSSYICVCMCWIWIMLSLWIPPFVAYMTLPTWLTNLSCYTCAHLQF